MNNSTSRYTIRSTGYGSLEPPMKSATLFSRLLRVCEGWYEGSTIFVLSLLCALYFHEIPILWKFSIKWKKEKNGSLLTQLSKKSPEFLTYSQVCRFYSYISENSFSLDLSDLSKVAIRAQLHQTLTPSLTSFLVGKLERCIFVKNKTSSDSDWETPFLGKNYVAQQKKWVRNPNL